MRVSSPSLNALVLKRQNFRWLCERVNALRNSDFIGLAGMETIDLTGDDESMHAPLAKRARMCVDSDVELVERPSLSRTTSKESTEERPLRRDEDILITRHTGQVRATSDGLQGFACQSELRTKQHSQLETLYCLRSFHNLSPQVWNRHLPHVRTQCGLHPFRPGKLLQNAEHCDQCYCYICDVAANSCPAWGTGGLLLP